MFWLQEPTNDIARLLEDENLWDRKLFKAKGPVLHPVFAKYCCQWISAKFGLIQVVPPFCVGTHPGGHRKPFYTPEELSSDTVHVIQTASVRAVGHRILEGPNFNPILTYGQIALCIVQKPMNNPWGELEMEKGMEVRYFAFEDDESPLQWAGSSWRPKIKNWFVMQIDMEDRISWRYPKAKDPTFAPGKLYDRWDATLVDSAYQAQFKIQNDYKLEPYWTEATAIAGSAHTDPQDLTVALCITTKNRLWQLRRALPLNLMHNWRHQKWCKVYLVDFGSTDGTFSWVMSNCRSAIDAGFLKFYYTESLPDWHASIGKNTAHRLAKEDILVNVDGDNLVGPDYALHVRRQFQDNPQLECFQYEVKDGTCGRIAIRRELFHELNGYDEDAGPMGGQDVDLVWRVQKYKGAQSWSNINKKDPKRIHHGQAIVNSIEAKVEHCKRPVDGAKLDWHKMDKANKTQFKKRLARGECRRNTGQSMIGVGVKQILCGKHNKIITCKEV